MAGRLPWRDLKKPEVVAFGLADALEPFALVEDAVLVVNFFSAVGVAAFLELPVDKLVFEFRELGTAGIFPSPEAIFLIVN